MKPHSQRAHRARLQLAQGVCPIRREMWWRSSLVLRHLHPSKVRWSFVAGLCEAGREAHSQRAHRARLQLAQGVCPIRRET